MFCDSFKFYRVGRCVCLPVQGEVGGYDTAARNTGNMGDLLEHTGLTEGFDDPEMKESCAEASTGETKCYGFFRVHIAGCHRILQVAMFERSRPALALKRSHLVSTGGHRVQDVHGRERAGPALEAQRDVPLQPQKQGPPQSVAELRGAVAQHVVGQALENRPSAAR